MSFILIPNYDISRYSIFFFSKIPLIVAFVKWTSKFVDQSQAQIKIRSAHFSAIDKERRFVIQYLDANLELVTKFSWPRKFEVFFQILKSKCYTWCHSVLNKASAFPNVAWIREFPVLSVTMKSIDRFLPLIFNSFSIGFGYLLKVQGLFFIWKTIPVRCTPRHHQKF